MPSAQFKKAVDLVGSLGKEGPVKPSQNDQLAFYGLYKQATIGDCNTSRPGMMDFTGKAKWDAWKSREGLSTEEAEQKYVEAFQEILSRNDVPETQDLKKQIEEAK